MHDGRITGGFAYRVTPVVMGRRMRVVSASRCFRDEGRTDVVV